MENRRTLFSHVRWIFSVSNRFSRVDRTGRSAVTSLLASLGISFGVMTLIVVMSVMNGFQMGFKDAIMEISSYHVRVSGADGEAERQFLEWCGNEKEIRSVTPFYEAESFVVGMRSRQSAAVIRAVPSGVMETDGGFARELTVTSGDFDISREDTIVLGSGLAYALGVRPGDVVTLLALSGGSDVELLSRSRKFIVTGIFHSGYADINASYAFVSLEAGRKNFGAGAEKTYGLKLNRVSADGIVISGIHKAFPRLKAESWRSYNRSFFGVLRVEKNMLMMLVFLIFVVVGINIYNGMRRLVFERRSEISILSALGGRSGEIKSIFIMRGFLTGCTGAFAGVVLGLLISVNIGSVFRAASDVMYYAQYFMVLAFNPENAAYVQENPMYLLYASIPARILPAEVFVIALFGILAPLAASFAASRNVLKMTVAEVLHDE
ncbi:MAG TPA: ABC transporter permease [Treponema sp.]|nr:ABC transporter permease [Treponema sp.]